LLLDISTGFEKEKKEGGSREAGRGGRGEEEREVIQHSTDLLFGVNDYFLVQQSWQQRFCYQGFYRGSLLMSQHDH